MKRSRRHGPELYLLTGREEGRVRAEESASERETGGVGVRCRRATGARAALLCRNVQLPTQAERGLLDRPHLSCIPRNLLAHLSRSLPGSAEVWTVSKGTLLPSLLAPCHFCLPRALESLKGRRAQKTHPLSLVLFSLFCKGSLATGHEVSRSVEAWKGRRPQPLTTIIASYFLAWRHVLFDAGKTDNDSVRRLQPPTEADRGRATVSSYC